MNGTGNREWPYTYDYDESSESCDEEWDKDLDCMVVDLTRSKAGVWVDKKDMDLWCHEKMDSDVLLLNSLKKQGKVIDLVNKKKG